MNKVKWLIQGTAIIFLLLKATHAQVELSGFTDVLYQQEEGGNNSFGMGAFEVDFTKEISDNISFEGAIVVEGGEAGLGQTLVEFKLLDDKLGLQAGFFDIPFGIDCQVFATPDRKLVSPPLVTELIMDGGWGDTGANIYGSLSFINYNIYIVNGMGEDNGVPVCQDTDNNNAKTIGSRIEISPAEDIEIGVSGAQGPYLDDNTEKIFSRFGCDVLFGIRQIKVKGEYIEAEDDTNKHSGYYLQLLGKATEKIYGVVRWGEWKPEESDEVTRLTLGFGYDIEENVSLKLEYLINNKKSVVSTQVVISF